jgi:hypothetical protein
MKLNIGRSTVLVCLFEIASTLNAGSEVRKTIAPVQSLPQHEAFRSDSTLRFLRRTDTLPPNLKKVPAFQEGPLLKALKLAKASEGPDKAEGKEGANVGPIEEVGNALEKADKDAGKNAERAMDGKPPKIPKVGKVGNPIEEAGEAMEEADKDAGKQIKDLQDPDLQHGPEGIDKDKEAPEKVEPAVAEEEPIEQPEDKEVPSVPGCKNSVKGWKDTRDQDCEDYAEGEWCTRHGRYGDGWLDEWGNFEDLAVGGKSATEVCCVCGGGVRKPSPGSEGGAPAAAPPAGAPMGPLFGTKVNRPLQEQGYHGKPVEHVDQETMTSDWGREFGPAANHRDFRSICAEHPGNEWCLMHGYFDKKTRSGAISKSMIAVSAMLFLQFLQ